MNVIPTIDDKVEALKIYLDANKMDREGDSWSFGHNPTIIGFLDTFNQDESNRLELELTGWEDGIVSNLADAVSQCNNRFIDGNYLYCKIFIQVSIFDDLEYLLQNLGVIIWHIRTKQSTEFWNRLEEKVKRINGQLNSNYDWTVSQIEKLRYGDSR